MAWVLIFALVVWVVLLATQEYRERVGYNNGVCVKCGSKLEHFTSYNWDLMLPNGERWECPVCGRSGRVPQ